MASPALSARQEYDADARSVAAARRFTREQLLLWDAPDLVDTAASIVSELVTNAVVHTGTTATLALRLQPRALRVEVEDRYPGRTVTMWPEAPDPGSEHGRGLLVTTSLSSRWGVEYTRSAKRVWAVCDRDGADGALVPFEEPSEVDVPGEPDPGPAHQGTMRDGAVASTALGLREDALARLGVQEYLALAVERVRDLLPADAAYLLLTRELDDELEVAAVSGLPDTVRGGRLTPGTPGTATEPDARLPRVETSATRLTGPLFDDVELRTLALAPLVVEGKVVGALGAGSGLSSGFDEVQSAQLQQFADSIALAADRVRLQASERERRGWLGFIADSGDLLAGSLDPGMTMAVTSQIVVPRIGTWCVIHLCDERGRPELRHVWHADETEIASLRSRIGDIRPEELVDMESNILGEWVTVLPLEARGKRVGFLTIGRAQGQLMRSELFVVVQSIARRAALALDNAQAHGSLRQVGRALQESLLPASMPQAPGLDVGVVYEPAGEDASVGGDFYDFFPLGRGRWCFVVGDVCGTGAGAAAVTGLARHTIQALCRAGFPLAATLERLNTAILDEGARARFMTLVAGTLQLERGRVRLDLVNAGHPPPLLVERGGRVRELGASQSLLGVFDRVAYSSQRHVLSRGDLLIAVTDGVLERHDPSFEHMLGEEGFAASLTNTGELPAQAVAELIRRQVVDFTDTPQEDDMAIMAIRVEMGAAAPATEP